MEMPQPYENLEDREKDIALVSSIVSKEQSYFEYVSREIWNKPELKHKEVHAHDLLTEALQNYGFHVEKRYVLPTAFRAEFRSKGGESKLPTIAFLCEYDALPEIGHGCGHNLIAEAGLAASVAVKTILEADPSIEGKVVVLGTPAEEGGGGKIRLIESGAFENIDAAMMVHPARVHAVYPHMLCIMRAEVTFKGKEAHAAAYPWEGRNALDAAVACYVSIGLLRQQMKPTCRIHAIITKGGSAANIIPSETKMEIFIRAPTLKETRNLQQRVKKCIDSAALSTDCEADYYFPDKDSYYNLVTNKVMASLYKDFAESFGVNFMDSPSDGVRGTGSTDMGNVSRVLPSIHPFYAIKCDCANHTKQFTEAAGHPSAQGPTLIAAKSMALTALSLIRSSKLRAAMCESFRNDMAGDN